MKLKYHIKNKHTYKLVRKSVELTMNPKYNKKIALISNLILSVKIIYWAFTSHEMNPDYD